MSRILHIARRELTEQRRQPVMLMVITALYLLLAVVVLTPMPLLQSIANDPTLLEQMGDLLGGVVSGEDFIDNATYGVLLSFNFLMLLVINDSLFEEENPFGICAEDGDTGMCLLDGNGDPVNACTFATPQHCATVRGLLGLSGLTRNITRAGGDGTFGRRTFVWQSGGEAVGSAEPSEHSSTSPQ